MTSPARTERAVTARAPPAQACQPSEGVRATGSPRTAPALSVPLQAGDLAPARHRPPCLRKTAKKSHDTIESMSPSSSRRYIASNDRSGPTMRSSPPETLNRS